MSERGPFLLRRTGPRGASASAWHPLPHRHALRAAKDERVLPFVTDCAMTAGPPSKVIFEALTVIVSPFAIFTFCWSTQMSGPMWAVRSP